MLWRWVSLCVQKWELNLLKDFEKCNDIQVVQILNYKENQLSKLQKTLNYQKAIFKIINIFPCRVDLCCCWLVKREIWKLISENTLEVFTIKVLIELQSSSKSQKILMAYLCGVKSLSKGLSMIDFL